MIDISLAPERYIQREGILSETGNYVKGYGRRPMVLGDALVFSLVRPTLEEVLSKAGLLPVFVLFGGECSPGEVQRVTEMVRQESMDFVVGVGAGRVLDTSRVVAGRAKRPLITLPTCASTCSAASSVAVIYEKGVRQEIFNGKGPDLVLVDTSIISKAPARLLAAGMGDALAKWYEGKPIHDHMKDRDSATDAAMNLSTQIKETIFTFGLEAKADVDQGRDSQAVRRIIEANILLPAIVSGLGARLRAAVAHGLLYGLGPIVHVDQNLHGDIVAFGMIVQLCLEKKEEELTTILPFFSKLGLPLTMKALGAASLDDPAVWEGLNRTCGKGSTVHTMPFPINPKMLLEGIREAERRAEAFRDR